MPRNLDGPVQTEMPATTFKSPLNGNYHKNVRTEGKSAGMRRVFMQTDTGCVLGMEVDRIIDNVHTVKRRLQIDLNVPVEERSVLKNGLSAIRNHNFLNRCSSTPILSFLPKERENIQKKDSDTPIEIIRQSQHFNELKPLVKDIVKAIRAGVDPIPVQGGLGGAYFFRNINRENVAIVKPTDEEPFAPNNPKGFIGKSLGQPGLKRSIRVGETGFREVAAYLLDHDRFANVPSTALVTITHPIFNINEVNRIKPDSKIASIQKFIPHDFDASDYGTSSFPVSDVHRIGILDVRIFNTDRHGGNILVKKLDNVGMFGKVELIPIDHGLCLPECLEDPYFEWIHWPQSSIPFSEEELNYIKNLDPVSESKMLRKLIPSIHEACLRVLILCTIFLKEAAGFSLCLSEIGEMMTREFLGGEEKPSELEAVCIEARNVTIIENDVLEGDDEFQFDLDCEGFESKSGARFSLSKLDESINEEREILSNWKTLPTDVSKLGMMSLKETILSEKSQKYSKAKAEPGHRSANEQVPTSANFVKLGDMNEEEWAAFLENFAELLNPAFEKRRAVTIGQKTTRLGTSCKF